MDEDNVLTEIDYIKDELDANLNMNSPYLMGGIAGILLFYHEYYKFKNLDSEVGKFEDMLNYTLEKAFENPDNYSFSYGLAGIGWLIDFFIREGRIRKSDGRIFNQCNDYLIDIFKEDMKKGNYDYLHGGLGICLYFINKNKINKSLIKIFIDEIYNLSRIHKNDRIWDTYDIKSKLPKENNLNLGLSHGIPSIIVILSHICRHEIQVSKCRDLLQQAIQTLLKCKNRVIPNAGKECSSQFAYELNNFEASVQSRLSWCYGDLGVAIALWEAGVALCNPELKNEAISIIKNSTLRTNLKENGVVDACICHGTVGIAHIYNQFYLRTKDISFKHHASYWIHQTLIKKIDNTNGLYETWVGGNIGWKVDYGLLEGTAGIGLALIDHLNYSSLEWNNCLLTKLSA